MPRSIDESEQLCCNCCLYFEYSCEQDEEVCYLNPPKIFVDRNGDTTHLRPVVQGDDFCQYFKQGLGTIPEAKTDEAAKEIQ